MTVSLGKEHRKTLLKSLFKFLKVFQSSFRVGFLHLATVSLESLPLKGHFRESCFNFKVMHVKNFLKLRKIEKKSHLGQITLRFI